MLILILRAKNSMQGEGEKRSRDARYYFTPGLDLFGKRSNCTPKSLKKYRGNDGIAPLPSPLALTLQSKMSVDMNEKEPRTQRPHHFQKGNHSMDACQHRKDQPVTAETPSSNNR